MQHTAQTPFFADFAALSSYLDELGLFRMTPGLERITAMLERLGLHRPPFVVVQVVGTNGKGSTSTMLASLGRAHGLCVGLHTSPHFLTPRERVRVNDALLSENAWVDLANTLMQFGGKELSYFEFVTVLAVQAFAEAGADLAVMETGLGGSWDATTALAADIVVLTPFDLDHQAVLGPTLADIAADKAGAIRRGKPVTSAPQRPEAWAEITRAAQEKNAPLHEVAAGFPLPPTLGSEQFPMRLPGEHQFENARVALASWRQLLGSHIFSPSAGDAIAAAQSTKNAEEREATALASAWLPGRMQRVPALAPVSSSFVPCSLGWPPLLLDGAHNRHGLAALGLALARAEIAPAAVIFACLIDKDPVHILPHLRALATGPVFVPPIHHNPRAIPPEELAAIIGVNAVPTASLQEAIILAAEHMADRLPEAFAGMRPQNPLLICGSLYLLGEFYALRPDCLEK